MMVNCDKNETIFSVSLASGIGVIKGLIVVLSYEL